MECIAEVIIDNLPISYDSSHKGSGTFLMSIHCSFSDMSIYLGLFI